MIPKFEKFEILKFFLKFLLGWVWIGKKMAV